MSNSVFPYFRLCGWREALLLCCVVIPLVWFHDFSLPQLFGPELSIPVFPSESGSGGDGGGDGGSTGESMVRIL